MVTGRWDIIDLTYQDRLLLIKPTCDMNYELDDLKSFHEYVLELVDHESHLVLADYRDHFLKLSNQTIKYAAKSPYLNERKIAEAVLVNSLPNLLIARFFIHTMKPLTPTNLFRQEGSALEWLQKHERQFRLKEQAV